MACCQTETLSMPLLSVASSPPPPSILSVSALFFPPRLSPRLHLEHTCPTSSPQSNLHGRLDLTQPESTAFESLLRLSARSRASTPCSPPAGLSSLPLMHADTSSMSCLPRPPTPSRPRSCSAILTSRSTRASATAEHSGVLVPVLVHHARQHGVWVCPVELPIVGT